MDCSEEYRAACEARHLIRKFATGKGVNWTKLQLELTAIGKKRNPTAEAKLKQDIRTQWDRRAEWL